jgi:hypothetical protein
MKRRARFNGVRPATEFNPPEFPIMRKTLFSLALLICPVLHAVAGAALELTAELKPDRVVITAGGKLFTEYLFSPHNKYPYFFPVNGPATGQSVTIHKTEPYPHHSSLFFGCDRVNGGNYWQEGLERGQIISKNIRVIRASGERVVFEQECLWERPGAEPPFKDRRTISISAPSSEQRVIDFEITMTALIKVRIEKNNHSLFAARMAPELTVKGGGSLINHTGAKGEKETFGKPSHWMHASGERAGQMEGLAILVHPDNRWFPPPWFTRDYGFFSPTPLNWLEKPLELVPGETIHLRYRVLVHSGKLSHERIEDEVQKWSGK